jgi:hypothetical protein
MKPSMNAASDVKVLLPDHKDRLLAFSKKRLEARVQDSMECELESWTAPWRAEALEHYLQQGWSYGLFSGAEIMGYVLAQPILFYRGLTQTLWIEHVDAVTVENELALIDTAYRWARDKHFQCVLVHDRPDLLPHMGRWPKARAVDSPLIEIRSAKF